MDLLILGVPRSGTSMLSNLMTSPPETLILYEPHLWMRRPSDHVNAQLRELGWSTFSSNRRLVKHLRRSTGRWGVKEVQYLHVKRTLETCSFRRLVLMVRNLEHAALSLVDRTTEMARSSDPERYGPDFVARPARWGQNFIKTSALLVDFYHRCEPERLVVIHYERFVSDPDYRHELEERLEWPMAGDLEVGLRRQGRWQEIGRHGRQVTAKSLDLRTSESDSGKRQFATELAAQGAAYQRLFGYAH